MRHDAWVNCLAFSPDDHVLVSGGEDYTARVWTVESEREIRTFPHDNAVEVLAIDPSGCILVTGYWGHGRIWSIKTGKKLAYFYTLGNIGSVAYSPDGRHFMVRGKTTIIMGDLTTKKEHAKMEYDHPIWASSLSPDGRYLATGHENGRVEVRNIATGKKHTIMHEYDVIAVLFSHDGEYLVVGDCEGTVAIYNWRNKKLIARISGAEEISEFLWYMRFFLWRASRVKEYSFFERLSQKDAEISAIALSRRGFLAIGYWNGLIETIREGKEL